MDLNQHSDSSSTGSLTDSYITSKSFHHAYSDMHLSESLKRYVVLYNNAMETHLNDAETFEQFLHKEENANAQAVEKFLQDFSTRQDETCFNCTYTSALEKLINEERSLFESKFLLKQTRLISEKMHQVIEKYNSNMTSFATGVRLEELQKFHKKAVQAAEDQLQELPALNYDHNLWAETKTQFTNTILMLQQNHFKQNELLLAGKKVERGTASLADTKIEANTIKIDMNRKGLLGRGSYGKVRVGFIRYYGTVAVKATRFCGSGVEIESAEEKFIKEIDLLHHANHDHIVRIIGYTSWKDSMAIVMEYMLGGNLSTLLLHKAEGDEFFVSDIPESLRLRFCSDISSGVCYLHFAFSDQRVVHGDLKPSNILLSGDLRCKISDFGGANLATCTEYHSSSSGMLHYHGQCTQGFIAPERLNNPQLRLSKAVDVYSVGIMFFVIFRRQNPTKNIDRNTKEILRYCRNFDRTSVKSSVIKTVKQLIQKCTDHNSQQRPDMLEVRDELQNLLSNQDSAEIVLEAVDVLRALKRLKYSINHSSFVCLADIENF